LQGTVFREVLDGKKMAALRFQWFPETSSLRLRLKGSVYPA